jgi:ABC-type lipoprotein release transport system permease subunit
MGKIVNFFNRIIDLGRLTYYFITSNRKALFISMIGLSIALAVIAGNWLLIDSYKGEILEESGYFSDSKIGDIQISIYEKQSSDNIIPYLNFDSFSNLTTESIRVTQYQDYLLSQYWHTEIDLKPTPESESELEEYDKYLSFKIPDNSFFNAIEELLKGHLPTKYTEAIIVKPKYSYERNPWWEPNWEELFPSGVLGGQINVTAYPEEGSLEKPNNINLTIVGSLEYELLDWQQTEFDDITSEQIHKYFFYETSYNAPTFFVTFSDYIGKIVQQIKPTNGSIDIFPLIFGKWYLDYSKINAFNIDSEIKKIEKTKSAFVRQFIENGFVTQGFDLRFSVDFIERLESFKNQFIMYQMFYQIFSTPVIVVALYLVFYSHNLIKKQKEAKIGIIKTRGGTRMQVFLFLWGELAVSTFIAIIGGLVLGYQLTGIARSTVDLLEFSGKIQYGSLPLVVIQDLTIWGIIIAIVLQFLTILRMSKTSIQRSIEPLEKRSPLWNRYYLDIIATVLGILGLNLINFIITADFGELPILYIIVPILIIPAPFLFFFGFIFLLSRFFPWLCRLLAEIFWRFTGGVKAFSLRNLVQHKHSANRAVLIITLALMYSVFTGSFTLYMDEVNRMYTYSDAGAEFVIETNPSNHITVGIKLQNISGVSNVSEILIGRIWQEQPFRNLNFFFIDPDTFAQTALLFEEKYGLSSTLPDLMDKIRENFSILLYEFNLDQYHEKKIGDEINFPVNNGTNNISLPFMIQGTFRYWPNFHLYSDDIRYTQYIIGSIDLFKEINSSISFSHIDMEYYIKPDPDVDIFQLSDHIINKTELQVHSPLIQHEYYLKSFFRKFLVSVLNSNLLICISISVLGITMFAFFTYIQRSKELGIERAFGMTKIQIGISFIIEASVILLFSCFIGIVIGLSYTDYIINLFFPPGNIPKISFIPIEFLYKLVLGIFLGAGIGTLLPVYLASNKDISRILKNE